MFYSNSIRCSKRLKQSKGKKGPKTLNLGDVDHGLESVCLLWMGHLSRIYTLTAKQLASV